MNQSIKTMKILLYASVVFIFLASVSVALIPLADLDGDGFERTAGYIIGLSFWICLTMGYLLLWRLNKKRRQSLTKYPRKRHKHQIGLFSLFNSSFGGISDIVCAGCLVTLIALLITGSENEWLTVTATASLVFSIHMHSIFNGENYLFLQYATKTREEKQDEKTG